jgi:hypothetical protein
MHGLTFAHTRPCDVQLFNEIHAVSYSVTLYQLQKLRCALSQEDKLLRFPVILWAPQMRSWACESACLQACHSGCSRSVCLKTVHDTCSCFPLPSLTAFRLLVGKSDGKTSLYGPRCMPEGDSKCTGTVAVTKLPTSRPRKDSRPTVHGGCKSPVQRCHVR